jgi:hypothetical protein
MPSPTSAEQAARPAAYVWLDIDGEPLPFQDHDSILEALRASRVVSQHEIGRGVAGARKLVLEFEGVRFHAAFRTVDVSIRDTSVRGARRPKEHRDAAIFEAAAYRLSQLLGLGRVPPAVQRTINGEAGTVQIWMEDTRPEIELVEADALSPPDAVRFLRQKQIMDLFDSLIANTDRNQGNLLVDRNWNIWLIDHTRAFKQSSKLLHAERLANCERSLWANLRAIDDDTLRDSLGPYLKGREISELLQRRVKLVRHIQSLIDKQGKEAVLFDLRPAARSAFAVNTNSGGSSPFSRFEASALQLLACRSSFHCQPKLPKEALP